MRRIKIKEHTFDLETIGADHGVSTVIYGFSLVTKKLNPKYLGLPGKELAELRKNETSDFNIEAITKKLASINRTSLKKISENSYNFYYKFYSPQSIERILKKLVQNL